MQVKSQGTDHRSLFWQVTQRQDLNTVLGPNITHHLVAFVFRQWLSVCLGPMRAVLAGGLMKAAALAKLNVQD